MPWEETENEIRHRERDPGEFEKGFKRFTLKTDVPRIYAIIGHLKGQTTTTIQALRFPKPPPDNWTMAKAKAWRSKHMIKQTSEGERIMLDSKQILIGGITSGTILTLETGVPKLEKVTIAKPRLEATLAPESANAEQRTVELQFYTGTSVRRYSFMRGEYNLAFSMDPGHVRLGRLNSGRAPLLDAHNDMSTNAVLGVIEEGRIEKGKGFARARFAKNDERADQVWNKVEQKILRNVSMGVTIHKLQETSKEEDKIKSYLAVDWEPEEISVVPIGADPGAQFLAASEDGGVEVELSRATCPLEEVMDKSIETAGEQARTPDAEALKAAQLAERARVTGIEDTKAKAVQIGLSKQQADQLAAEAVRKGTSVEEFRTACFNARATEAERTPMRAHAVVTRDETDTRRELATVAALNLIDPVKYKVEGQNDFAGLRISRIAEELLTRSGVQVRGRSVAEIANLTMHATADFPYILENVARKRLLDAYQVAAPTYRQWTAASTATDFKTMSRPRLSETPSFLVVPEGAQITLGTMTESRETYAIATYGRGVSFTRQMLINDDLGAFNNLIFAFGLQAARLENKTVYAILIANAPMSDTIALFFATHYNLGAGVIGNTGLDSMFTAMGIQKGLDGATILNLIPKYLIVPLAKAATAQAALTAVGPNVKAADQNWFAGRLTVVADGELDASSTAVWYGAADPALAPGIEYAYLEGAAGPQIIRKENEGAILGVQLYAYLDFGAKAIDWRPLYKSTGV